MQRIAVVLCALALGGCPLTAPSGGECTRDSDCSDQVCARDKVCHDTSDVRGVTVSWTISGAAANATTCAGRELYVEFDGIDADQTLGFEPVPCESGRFFVDKLPNSYIETEVGTVGRGAAATAPIDSQNAASVDLRL